MGCGASIHKEDILVFKTGNGEYLTAMASNEVHVKKEGGEATEYEQFARVLTEDQFFAFKSIGNGGFLTRESAPLAKIVAKKEPGDKEKFIIRKLPAPLEDYMTVMGKDSTSYLQAHPDKHQAVIVGGVDNPVTCEDAHFEIVFPFQKRQ
eukprot:TRINITY_DN96670_c0_g1_i1.p1 TRINITY_DN96670_c0_g1~~TRINITY_DN96670_c0_g1_i1.p1  ORF type:complete len:150 (+),score=20.56 TRINITY_DN96670_c0_g1_i1:82-531(+)